MNYWTTPTGLICVIVCLAANTGARADVNLTFGTYSSDKPSAMVRQLDPTIRAIRSQMARTLGEPVTIKMKVVRAYTDGVQLLIDGGADFARLGAASYVLAKGRRPSIKVLAMENKRGKKVFNGVIAVHRNSPIHSVSDLRGRVFGFGSQRSTLGRYLAQLFLIRHGIYAPDLKSFTYLGRHDKVGAAVGAQLVDAGALEETRFAKLVQQGVPLRSLATFRGPTKTWVVRGELPKRLRNALRSALLDLKDPATLRSLRFDGFLVGSDADFAAIREAIMKNPNFLRGRRVTAR